MLRGQEEERQEVDPNCLLGNAAAILAVGEGSETSRRWQGR